MQGKVKDGVRVRGEMRERESMGMLEYNSEGERRATRGQSSLEGERRSEYVLQSPGECGRWIRDDSSCGKQREME